MSTTLPSWVENVLTVASSSGIPATTMSPCCGLGLLADDHEVAVDDAGVDHRVTLDPEHEQRAVPVKSSGSG